MLWFCPLFSGSSGNATFVGIGEGGGVASGVLIDAGRSAKAILTALALDGIDPACISAILLTHSHSDHICGLRVLQKKLGVPVYASAETLEALRAEGCMEPNADLRELSGDVEIAGIYISPFPTPHDAAGALGFVLEASGRRIGYATDLGAVTEGVVSALSGCSLVMLEANYDPHMLTVSRYPYPLKRRIASATGHLSNDDSAAALTTLARSGCYHLVLAHLSAENNFPELARQTALAALAAADMIEGRDFALTVCSRTVPTTPIKL